MSKKLENCPDTSFPEKHKSLVREHTGFSAGPCLICTAFSQQAENRFVLSFCITQRIYKKCIIYVT